MFPTRKNLVNLNKVFDQRVFDETTREYVLIKNFYMFNLSSSRSRGLVFLLFVTTSGRPRGKPSVLGSPFIWCRGGNLRYGYGSQNSRDLSLSLPLASTFKEDSYILKTRKLWRFSERDVFHTFYSVTILLFTSVLLFFMFPSMDSTLYS